MAQASNADSLDTELCLATPDPWVLKKRLSDSDICNGGRLMLPKRDFERFIMPEMDNVMVQNLGSSTGIKVKIHVVGEGDEAGDYTVTFFKNTKYWFAAGWIGLAKAKGYKSGDEIGLMWDKSSERFLLHRIK